MSLPKRQFRRSSYEEIIENAVQTFGPVIHSCTDYSIKTYEYTFHGIDSTGSYGWVTLIFQLQLLSTHGKTFRFEFKARDRHGDIETVRSAMDAFRVRKSVHISCSNEVWRIAHEIRVNMSNWLDFAQQTFVERPG